ncbi:MAG: RpoL/Rpb11 RNA polymerase subunit family protein [Nanoarchaeota archaeon]
MHIDVISSSKDDMEFKIDNITLAELFRIYLNEHGVKFAAWRREHPSKPIVMKIQTSSGTVKKAVSDAASAIQKDLDSLLSVLKKK